MSKSNWDAWEDAMEERAPKPVVQQPAPKIADPPKLIMKSTPVPAPAPKTAPKPVKPPSAWEIKQRKMNAAVRQHMQQEAAWHRFRHENESKVFKED